jgi:cytochrome c556
MAMVVAWGMTGPGILAPRLAVADEPAGVLAAIEHRHHEIRKMSAAMRVIGSFLKNEGATVADVGRSADVIRMVANELQPALFPEGTAAGIGGSEAKPELWQQWELFRERAVNLATAAARLSTAAASGDGDAVHGPIVAVGQACAACHELFRRKKQP